MNQFEAQLDSIIAEYEQAAGRSKYPDLSDVFNSVVATCLLVTCQDSIARIAGRDSQFFEAATTFPDDVVSERFKLQRAIGAVKALKNAIANGWLQTHAELIHGDLFGSFLEMSQHLLDTGYKDAAAVIAGSSLEAHVRELCKKHFVSVSGDDGKPLSSNFLIAELKKARVYNDLDHKQLVAWQDLRNKAAHGHYEQYDANAVRFMVQGITNFITRYPA